MFQFNHPIKRAGAAVALGLVCWLTLAICAGTSPRASHCLAGAERSPVQPVPRLIESAVVEEHTERAPRFVEPVLADELNQLGDQPLEDVSLPGESWHTHLSAIAADQNLLRQDLARLRQEWGAAQEGLQQQQDAERRQLHARLDRWEPELHSSMNQLESQLAELRQLVTIRQAAPTAGPVLTTKLYQPLHLHAAELEPLLAELLTPGTGLWAASNSDGQAARAILVRDHPEVIAQVDLLIEELDRPRLRVELDVATVTLDRETGNVHSAPISIPAGDIARDGPSFLLREAQLFPDRGDEFRLPRLATSAVGDSSPARSIERVIRITPRIVR